MTRRLTSLMMLLALTGLTACDYGEKRDFRQERESRDYQSAMADYRSGRLPQAIKGFRKVCRAEPANASARFQLACLLQDSGKDLLEAYCSYREYLMQMPDSDKASLARDRAALCERELARQLAEKHGLTDTKALSSELEDLRRQLKESETRCAKAREDVSLAMRRIAHLRQENGRLMATLRNDADGMLKADAAGVRGARALLEEDDVDRIANSEDIASLRTQDDSGDFAPVVKKDEIADVRRASDADDDKTAPGLLESLNATHPAPVVEKKAEPPPQEPPHEKRPDSYVVQEGDTLYKLAIRFYGRKSAWKLIRDANKAAISMDGRIRAGLKIRLPDVSR